MHARRWNASQRNSSIRAALVSVREPGELRDYYERKRAEGKKPILVVNAVRNKLVHRVCAVIRRGQPFKPFLEPSRSHLKMT